MCGMDQVKHQQHTQNQQTVLSLFCSEINTLPVLS